MLYDSVDIAVEINDKVVISSMSVLSSVPSIHLRKQKYLLVLYRAAGYCTYRGY